jgi:ABC-type nitrate/sulfonate/bicarbonate transport system substrate-binding protein
MVELEDTLALPEGDFNMLANFTEELSDIKTNLIYANRDFAAEHPDVVQAFVTELTKLQQQAMEDPAFFAELVTKWVPDTAADIDEVVAAYIAQGMLPTDGGMSQSDLESSIAFYTEAEVLEPGLTPEQIADRSFIEEAMSQ